MKYILIRLRLLICCFLFLIGYTTVYGQVKSFVDGVQRGTVKVKFTPAMGTKLVRSNIRTKNNQLSTGISDFDKAALKVKASNMRRLFPYDPKNEDKLVKHGLHLWYILDIDTSVEPESAVSILKDVNEISTVECNFEKVIIPHKIKLLDNSYNISSHGALPFDDPYLRLQWNYQNTGQNGYPGGADINLFEAWKSTAGASDIIISVHDGGIDINHVDLKDNIWINTKEIPGNGIDDDGNGYIDDVYGFNFYDNSANIVAEQHGTHIAGTIAAVNNNGIGVSGIAGGTGRGDGVRIMPLQIIKNNDLKTGSGIIEPSYIYAANSGAIISQNSWGYKNEGLQEQSVLDAINYFIEEAGNYENSPMKGGIVIFAAGNDNKETGWFPANLKNVLKVGAIRPDWKKSSYSNFGEGINISAPGGEFLLGSNAGILSTVLNNQYGYMEGTSMACPHVTGIVALALANRTKQMTNIELWDKIITGIKNIDVYNPDYAGKMGVGIVDAFLAIKNNENIAPDKINDLNIGKITQEDIELIWKVPEDKDDSQPSHFIIYYSKDSITKENINTASEVKISNNLIQRDSFKYIVDGLSSNSRYYFVVESQDRWKNVSELSNVINAKTSIGPRISIEGLSLGDTIEFRVDASSLEIPPKTFFIKNKSEGILRWESEFSNIDSSSDFDIKGNLILTPPSGTVNGNSAVQVSLSTDVSNLKNGIYKSELLLRSNDSDLPEYKIHIKLIVENHSAELIYPKIVDFNEVELGQEITKSIFLENIGLGDMPDLYFSIDNPQFKIISGDFLPSILAQSKASVSIIYKPLTALDINGILKIYSQDRKYEYKIHLTGSGQEAAEIGVSPDVQQINSVIIGDEISTSYKITNNGEYPLKYFIPEYDSINISTDWPTTYNSYGYRIRSNEDVDDPINYSFSDISTTGVDITSDFLKNTANWYYELDLKFLFPFYDKEMDKIYITRKGFTTFDKTVNPSAAPKLGMSNTPRGYISLLGFNTTELTKKGRIYYKVEQDKLIIQYTDIWRGMFTYPEMNLTAQMVLYSNGDIRFYYDDITARVEDLKIPVVLIESYERNDGILLSSTGAPYTLKSGLALGLDYPGPDIIESVLNGAGIVASNDTATIKVSFNTRLLKEGITNKYINIISNDPVNPIKNVFAKLDVVSGGTAEVFLSKDNIDFGNIFENASISDKVLVKNIGSAKLNILNIVSENNVFSITGAYPFTINPGSYKDIEIEVPTSVLTSLQDNILIKYSTGDIDTIQVKANVIAKPDIDTDISPLNITANMGDIISYPLNIKNTGGSTLELSVKGNDWINFQSVDLDKGYVFSQKNDGDSYEWVDIRIIGKRLPDVVNGSDMSQFWQSIDLPFTFNYYGKEYSSLKISPNGVITLGNDNPQWLYAPVDLPLPYNEAFIFPFWIDGSPDVTNYGKEAAGVFYWCDNNKCIVSWEYMMNSLEFGDPISFQAILYKNGYLKFQYRLRGTTDYNANLATIGIQKQKIADYKTISRNKVLDYGSGLTFIISPEESHLLEPDESITGTLSLNTNHVLGGVYHGNLEINSNVPDKELQNKLIDLTVNGVPALAVKDTINFGKILNQNRDSIVQCKSFFIVNSGSAPLNILKAEVFRPNQYFDLNMPYTIAPSSTSYLYPTVDPGKSIIAEAIFKPHRAIGDFANKIILTTNAGVDTIHVVGVTYEPPVINIERDSLIAWLPNRNENSVRERKIDNMSGKYPLEYKVDIKYLREQQTSEQIAASSNKSLQSDYNREIKYTDDTVPHSFYGADGKSYTSVATKYNAGNQSFNMSHLRTYFRTDNAIDCPLKIYAEVRTGGESITDAKVTAKGSIVLNPVETDYIGKFYTIKLDNPAEIYPNEDFYVVVIYPLDIANPQGSINNTTNVSGRYFYMTDNGVWRDLQSSNKNAAWLMTVAEKEEKSFDWLVSDSQKQNMINAGDSTFLKLRFVGSAAKEGYQYANVMFRTNDPNNEEISIPVSLYVNQAPTFKNVPENIEIFEGTSHVYEIEAADIEGDKFLIKSLHTTDFTSFDIDSTKLKLTISPQYGDAGIYTIKFIATDVHNASQELDIKINVFKSNRPPIYTGLEDKFVYNTIDEATEYNINDLFLDPDGDNFTFTIQSQDENIVSVSQSGVGYFVISPIAEGTTNLIFTLKDEHGAINIHSIMVIVRSCIGSDGIIAQKKNNMLQLKNFNNKNIIGYQWFKNNEPIPDATRKIYVVNKEKKELDFTAEYVLRIVTETDTIYTCPYKPVREGIALHVTPNPVKQGEQVKIEIGCSDTDLKKFTIRVISLSGHVLRKIVTEEEQTFVNVNFEKGTYLIELLGGKTERVVRLVVI